MLAVLFATSPWPLLGLLIVVVLIGIGELRNLALGPWLPLELLFFAPFLLGRPDLRLSAGLGFGVFLLGIVWMVLALCRKVAVPRFTGWFVLPLSMLWLMHYGQVAGGAWNLHTILILPIVPLWVGDSAAIFAGRAFGKHLMAPTISPKKTWEGGFANFLGCVLGAWAVGVWCGVGVPQALVCGALMGILGQVGDLFESALKRQAGRKDSGALLPGHGGILDRIDSLIFSAPAVVFVLMVWS